MNRNTSRVVGASLLLNSLVLLAVPGWAAISDTPLFLTQSVDPRIMLVMSNDHQLSIKAYTDYTDLDSDGSLDTSYSDSIDYSGYFDSNKCYTYSTTNSRFEPAVAVDTGTHQCSTSNDHWSGNFLNWGSMTRMDLVRNVFYGGLRSTDTDAETVLERAYLPDDVHAFAKVFSTSTTTEMRNYTPYAQTSITLCNFTDGGSSLSKDVSSAPLVRVASGSWPRWASYETVQCGWGVSPRPEEATYKLESGLTARVLVCESGLLESNCRNYSNGNDKPAGLLQEFGEETSNRPIRFGLMTGSYQKNKSGGSLRRNLERITGNATATDNEIDTSSGIFINQTTSDEGIINTLNRLRISRYSHSANKYDDPSISGGSSACESPGTASFIDGECADWGNPLSEMYLEALRYLAGKTSATTAFDADDSSYIAGLNQVAWSDPMPSTEYCADTSIIAISTGLNSFDTDQLTGHGLTGLDVAAQTNTVGTVEGISGSYVVGQVPGDDDDQCTEKTLSNLADAKGVCPEMPSLEGGYQVAGLAYYARTNDLRTDSNYVGDQTITTYGVALAESLPKFEAFVGSGANKSTVTILPHCEANTDKTSFSDGDTAGWRICSMTDLAVQHTSDSEGSFLVSWEDSTWGNDYDMDAVMLLEYCVGSSCPNTNISDDNSIGTNQVRTYVKVLGASAGHAIKFGYTLSGTTADGVLFPAGRDGDCNFSVGATSKPSECNGAKLVEATTTTHTQGVSSASQLESPLWYAAKFGGFNEGDDTTGPNLDTEWDEDADGTPDTFFLARNPAKLGTSLSNVFNDVVSRVSTASAITTNSTRLDTNSLAFRALFNSGDWSGQFLALPINSDGSLGTQAWDAAEQIPAHGSRNIISWDSVGSDGFEFEATSNLGIIQAMASGLDADEVNHLRGDTSNEQQNSGTLRDRPVVSGQGRVLGDIVNSDPVFVSTENFGYESLGGSEGTAYATFRASSSYTGRKPMLYVGANDGMLHGFYVGEDTNNDGTLDADGGVQPGQEVFAFIPSSIYANLESLTSPTYTHKYFVDGSPHVGDAYIDAYGTGDAWRTILIGTTGAGGKGVFALDITDPDSFLSSGREANVLWEINDTVSDFSDMGYMLGKASIAKLEKNDTWVAVFANGYSSTSGKAVIYIVDLATGALLKSFDTDPKDLITGNGMSTPILIDSDGNKRADTIYAGDLKGNLWKINVSGNSVSSWDFSFSTGTGSNKVPAPLFIAKDQASPSVEQPITAKPQVGAHSDGGVMVYFGTGQYFETGDNTVPATPQVQTFYGIRDEGAQVLSDRSELVEQEIIAETTAFAFNVRVTTENTDTSSPPTKTKGWFMNLKTPGSNGLGERAVNEPILRSDRLLFTTTIPDEDVCGDGGDSWLMEVEAQTGSRLAVPPFDLNNDGVFNDTDKVLIDTDNDGVADLLVNVSGIQKAGMGIMDNPAILDAGSKDIKIMSGSSGSTEAIGESNSDSGGRQAWQQLR